MSENSGASLFTKVRIIGVAIIALLVVVIVMQNTETVDTKLLFLTISVPRAALLFVTLIVGYLLGILTAFRMISRRKPE